MRPCCFGHLVRLPDSGLWIIFRSALKILHANLQVLLISAYPSFRLYHWVEPPANLRSPAEVGMRLVVGLLTYRTLY